MEKNAKREACKPESFNLYILLIQECIVIKQLMIVMTLLPSVALKIVYSGIKQNVAYLPFRLYEMLKWYKERLSSLSHSFLAKPSYTDFVMYNRTVRISVVLSSARPGQKLVGHQMLLTCSLLFYSLSACHGKIFRNQLIYFVWWNISANPRCSECIHKWELLLLYIFC